MDEITNKNEKIYNLKISIFSKDEKIERQFLKSIKAIDVFDSSKKPDLGVDFANLSYSYRRNKKYLFQFWSISNESRFEVMIPNLILNSLGIIYFYQINEKIEENRLKLIKKGITFKIPILFIGYDSNLLLKPKQVDDNIRLIKKYFSDFVSLYMSVDNPDSMFQILDRIIAIIDLISHECDE